MVSNLTILCCVVSLFISLFLPLLALAVLGWKYRGQGVFSAWFLGAAGFFVPQIIIRMPIMNALAGMDWFIRFSQEHLFLYSFTLAFSAGLFELAGRLAAAKLMRKKLTYPRALTAGMGHGGIEAILLIGMTYINNLLYIFMINGGTFDAMVAQAAAAGADAAQLAVLKETFLTTPPLTFLLGGFERLLTMILHVALSMMVCYAMEKKQLGKGILACLVLHTFLDTTAGISLLATPQGGNVLSQGAAYAIVFAILIAVAVLSVFILITIRRRWLAESSKGGIL